jgi:hypothetical protein
MLARFPFMLTLAASRRWQFLKQYGGYILAGIFLAVVLQRAYAILPTAAFTAPPEDAPSPGERKVSINTRNNAGQQALLPVIVATTTITIPVYPFQNALVTERNATYNISYYRLDRSRYNPNAPLESRTLTAVTLENEWLRLTILPELGGRVYQCVFKPTGHNMFYQNPVLKPSSWGPPEQGWWLAAGGMEWGLPVEEHGYEWGIPWRYKVSTDAAGAAVTLRDSTADDRLRAQIMVRLPAGAAYFTVSPRLENPTASAINYKFWLNAMLAPAGTNHLSPDLRFILPADQVTIHSSGDKDLPPTGQAMSWPIYKGRDMSRLGNWRGWLGFFQRPAAAGDFIAVYDEAANRGAVRVYPGRIARGAKGFGFGWGSQALPPQLYTDDDSAYVEIHGGLAPTFADFARLGPGESVEWTEVWYPLMGIGGLVTANRDAALNLNVREGQATIGVALTATRENLRIELRRRNDGKLLFVQKLPSLAPDTPYVSSPISVSGLSRDDLSLAIFGAAGQVIAAYQYVPAATPTPTMTPTATPTPMPGYTARVATRQVGGWFSIIRVWVRGQYGLPVTIWSEDRTWHTVNYVGTKPEYGPDALEFAPLGAGIYIVSPQGLGVEARVPLEAGSLGEVVFEPVTTPTISPTPSPTPTATPTLATPTPSPTPSPTATSTPGWVGRILRNERTGGWFGVVRVWVRGQYGLPVTIWSEDRTWHTVNYVGSKPEYGPDALEFAPLGANTYIVIPDRIGTSVTLPLQQGGLAEVLFEPGGSVPTPTPTPQPTATPTSAPGPGG